VGEIPQFDFNSDGVTWDVIPIGSCAAVRQHPSKRLVGDRIYLLMALSYRSGENDNIARRRSMNTALALSGLAVLRILLPVSLLLLLGSSVERRSKVDLG